MIPHIFYFLVGPHPHSADALAVFRSRVSRIERHCVGSDRHSADALAVVAR